MLKFEDKISGGKTARKLIKELLNN